MIKKICRSIALAAIFLIPIFPLIVANSFFFPFITGKAFYFRILVEVAFAAWLILCLLDAKYRPKWTPINIAVALFALVTLAADLLGINPLRSLWSNFERMEGWITIIHLAGFYFVTTCLFGYGEEGRRLWHRFLNSVLFIGLIVAGYGLVQLFGWAAIHQGSTRIDASLGNAAYMAVYMLFNAGLASYLFFVARAKQIANHAFLKWAYPILALLFGFEVFETATRGTILGLIGGILLALFLYAVFAREGSKDSRRNSGIAIAVILVIGIGFWLARNQPFVQNNEVLERLASISLADAQTEARSYIWPMALKGFVDRPILGWGQENFNYIFNQYYNPKIWNQEQWFDRAHSVYLDWLSESGLVGLLSYLSLYVLFLVVVWRSSLKTSEKSVLTGLLAGYAVHNVFVFDNLASYALFFSALGFMNSLSKNKPIKALGTQAASAESVEYIAAPAIIIALVFVLYFFNVRPIDANTDLITALEGCGNTPDTSQFDKALGVNAYVANQEIREQYLSCAQGVITNQQAPLATKNDYFTLANQVITDQIAATPWKDTRIYALGGAFMNAVGHVQPADDLLTVAHELSPEKQSITLQLAITMINLGQAAQAVQLLGPVYKETPADTDIRDMYIVALVASGQDALAKSMFPDPTLFQNLQIAQAYTLAKQYTKAVAVYQALVKANPTDITTVANAAQAEYAAGMFSQSIATLRSLESSHPEYKDQIEASVKQIQSQ